MARQAIADVLFLFSQRRRGAPSFLSHHRIARPGMSGLSLFSRDETRVPIIPVGLFPSRRSFFPSPFSDVLFPLLSIPSSMNGGHGAFSLSLLATAASSICVCSALGPSFPPDPHSDSSQLPFPLLPLQWQPSPGRCSLW